MPAPQLVPSNGRFIDNQDSTVTDTCTGLMWQKDTADSHAHGQPNEQDYVFSVTT
jgi:hypothetical protein